MTRTLTMIAVYIICEFPAAVSGPQDEVTITSLLHVVALLCHIEEQMKRGEFVALMKSLYNSLYKLGSSRSFECIRFVLILDL